MRELGITVESDKNNLNINNINKPVHEIDRNITTLKGTLNKLFTESQTVKNVDGEIQLKDEVKLIQQKVRPIPYPFTTRGQKGNRKTEKTRTHRKCK